MSPGIFTLPTADNFSRSDRPFGIFRALEPSKSESGAFRIAANARQISRDVSEFGRG